MKKIDEIWQSIDPRDCKVTVEVIHRVTISKSQQKEEDHNKYKALGILPHVPDSVCI